MGRGIRTDTPVWIAPLLAASFALCSLPAAAAAPGGAAEPGFGQPRLDRQHFELQAKRLGGMRAQVATLLVQGGVGGGIAAEVLAVPLPGPGEEPEERAVAVLVEIEGPTLLAAYESYADQQAARGVLEEGLRQRLEVYAYALTPHGAVTDFFSQLIRLDLAVLGERIYNSGLKLVGSLSLPPGTYSLRMLVMDSASGQYGLRTVPLLVPDPRMDAPLLLGSLVPEPPDSWILVREDVSPDPGPRRATAPPAAPEAEGGKEGGRAETEEPVPQPPAAPEGLEPADVLARLPVAPASSSGTPTAGLPAAFPLFDGGSTVEVQLLTQNLSRTPDLSALLTPQQGGEPRVLPVEILDRRPLPESEMEVITGRFQVPRLETSAHLLAFQVETAGGSSTSGQIRALVLADNPLGERLVWGQLRSAAATVDRTASRGTGSAPLDLPRRRKRRVRALEEATRQRYGEALGGLGTGAADRQVIEAIAAMERQIFGEDPSEALPALQRGELALARRLAELEPESLVPLIRFHLELYLRYRREHDYPLATHARTTMIEMAELYTGAADTDDARALASRALTSLATEMLEAGLRNSGAETLERALELDETNEAARNQLAVLYEKLGRYEQAVKVLRKLVEIDPKAGEGRLRLALNLLRIEEEEQGERELLRLISESNPPWVLTVAYSELGSLYLDQGRVAEASRVLRAGFDRLPEQDRLAIQLAFALDRQRRFMEARQVLAQVAAREHHLGEGGSSPRHRYARSTDPWRDGPRNRVLEAARVRQPLLVGILGRLDTGGS